MAVVPHGKNAYTRFRPVQCLEKVSLLEAELFTGRTHQIRVHLSHAGFYVLGDPVYGNVESRLLAPRVFLHSYYLELEHPITGERLFFVSPLPEDLDECWHILGAVTLYTLRFVRENEKLMREALRKRQYDESILDQLLALDEQRRKEVTSLQELNTRRNELTSVVSKKKKEGTDASEEIELLKNSRKKFQRRKP